MKTLVVALLVLLAFNACGKKEHEPLTRLRLMTGETGEIPPPGGGSGGTDGGTVGGSDPGGDGSNPGDGGSDPGDGGEPTDGSGSTGGGSDGGTGGGSDPGDGGTDGGTVGGSDPGDGGTDGGTVGGSDPGDGGTDGGSTGGGDTGGSDPSDGGSTDGSGSTGGGNDDGTVGGSDPGDGGDSDGGTVGGNDPGEDDDSGNEPGEYAGCTRTQGYWKNHHESGKGRNQRVDWPAPRDEKERLCSASPQTLLENLRTPPKGNAVWILSHQYIAAELNVASGAGVPPDVAQALRRAAELLEGACAERVDPSSPLGQEMVTLSDLLDRYNNGLVGPAHCR